MFFVPGELLIEELLRFGNLSANREEPRIRAGQQLDSWANHGAAFRGTCLNELRIDILPYFNFVMGASVVKNQGVLSSVYIVVSVRRSSAAT